MTNLETRVFICGTIGPVEIDEIDLRDEDALLETIFCCFFRTEEGRTQFMSDLKRVAADASVAQEMIQTASTDELQELIETVNWWAHTKRKPYHAYKLKAEYPPYSSSCAIAFIEPESNDLKLAVLRSLQVLEQDKSRVHEFFGFDTEVPFA